MVKGIIAAALFAFAGAAAGQVEYYQGTQIIREDGFANFNTLKYPDSILNYQEGGLIVSMDHIEFEFVQMDGTASYYPNAGDTEMTIITRADGENFQALEFQVWNGWATDPNYVWAEAYLGGELQASFDIDHPSQSQNFPVLGFKGRFDQIRIASYYEPSVRDAHDPAGYQAIAMDNMRFGTIAGDACYADFDEDGELSLFDFLAYVNSFNAGSDDADCDGDGDLTLFDFLCFVNAFNAGC